MPTRSLKETHWPLTLLSSLAALLNMFLPIIMVRVLPTNEVGEFRIFFLYLAMLPSLCMIAGMLNGIYFWASKREHGLRLIQTAGAILFALSCMIPLAAFLLHLTFSKYINWSPIDWPGNRWNLFFLAAMPTLFLNFYEFSAIATGRIWKGALFSAVFDIVRTGLLILISFWKRDLLFILWAHIIISYLRIGLAVFLGYRESLLRFTIQKSDIKELFQYAMPVSISGAFDILLNTSDRIMVSSTLTSTDFAFYTVGCLSIPPLLILEQSINKVLIPRLGMAMQSSDKTLAVTLYSESMGELLSFFIPTVIGILTFADPIVRLLFTEKYIQAVPYLRVYSLTYLLLGIPHDSLARAIGDGKWIMRTFITFGLLSICIVFAFTKTIGATGALMGLIVGQFLFRTYGLVQTKGRLEARWTTLLPLGKAAGCLIVSGILAACSLMVRNFFSSEMTWFLTLGPIFGITYLSFTFFPRISSFCQRFTPTKLIFRDLEG